MALTRDFKETVQARARRDQTFREGLLKEGIESLLSGDVDTGKVLLRDYVNATIGYQQLGSLTNKPPKSLMRMFGPAGNPHARNLFEVISEMQCHEGVRLEVHAVRYPPNASAMRRLNSARISSDLRFTAVLPSVARRP